MVPAGGKVTVFTEDGLDIPQVHAKDQEKFLVVYTASKESLEIFLTKCEGNIHSSSDPYVFSETDRTVAPIEAITDEKEIFSPTQISPKKRKRNFLSGAGAGYKTARKF